jgi:hypothetical protein
MPDHILRCDCGYEFVTDSALSLNQEEVARGERLQKIGFCLIAAGAFFALCLIIAYSSVSQQISQWEALRQKFYKEFKTKDLALISLAVVEVEFGLTKDDPDKKRRVDELKAEIIDLDIRNEEAWKKTEPYSLIAFCCYLTSFIGPEGIRVASKFWPGLTAMSLLLIAGGAVYWMGKRKIGEDGTTTTLRLSD